MRRWAVVQQATVYTHTPSVSEAARQLVCILTAAASALFAETKHAN